MSSVNICNWTTCNRNGRGITFVGREKNPCPSLVRKIRKQLGLSQEGLARDFGVSFATVNRWENAQVKPSKLPLAQLSAFCGKRAEEGKLK